MHTAKDRSGHVCEVYDNFDEVDAIAYRPPRYCEKCGKPLTHYSFYDSLNRFTLNAGCDNCGTKRAISVKEDKYEARMLNHWTEEVKRRAGYQCEKAGPDCAGDLHAHHIIPKHMDPTRKYDVTNGICLCEKHHKMIHRYM